MTADGVLVVHYRESDRLAAQQTMQVARRTQGVLLLVLGLIVALIGPGLFVAVAIFGDGFSLRVIAAIVGLSAIPVTMWVFAVRKLRRPVHLPEIAVTITPNAVRFPAIEKFSALSPRLRAEEWPRMGTSAELLPAAGLNAARIVFTRQDAGKRRRRMVAAGTIDVDPRAIVDALSRP